MAEEAGRTFAITKGYYDMGSGTVPTPFQRDGANIDGSLIHISLALNCNSGQAYNSRLPAPLRSTATKQVWTYKQVTSGKMDAYFYWLARQTQAVGRNFTICVNHEPENQANGVGRNESFSDPTWYSSRASTSTAYRQGILKEYADAMRHVSAIFVAAGTTRARWMNTFASIGSNGAEYNRWVYPALWPGDDVIDVFAWDPYDSSNNKTPLSTFRFGYDLVRNGLVDAAPFYVGTGAKNKPFMLGEYGTSSVAGAAYVSDWLAKVPGALSQLPQIKGLTYWSSSAYAVHNNTTTRRAFADASRQPYVAYMPAA
jgi:hypothetical protein